MIIGEKTRFAIESKITKAYQRLSFRALGYFAIHVAGQRYGVKADNATMLACSFDAVKRRIEHRGLHAFPSITERNGRETIYEFHNTIYKLESTGRGYPRSLTNDLVNVIQSRNLIWAPDGDEAFDDGSFILQFDVDTRVRIIAARFEKRGDQQGILMDTFRDVWLQADEFYNLLRLWHDQFEANWLAAKKIVESEEGTDQ